MYGLSKVYKKLVDGFHPLKPILSASKTPACELAKFLPITLSPISIYENSVNNSFRLSSEILEQDSSLFMRTFDVD